MFQHSVGWVQLAAYRSLDYSPSNLGAFVHYRMEITAHSKGDDCCIFRLTFGRIKVVKREIISMVEKVNRFLALEN